MGAREYCGKVSAPARAVTALGKSGWANLRKLGASKGWVYFYVCKLECGHEQIYRTETFHCRQRDDFPSPKYLNCDTCLKEGAQAAPHDEGGQGDAYYGAYDGGDDVPPEP